MLIYALDDEKSALYYLEKGLKAACPNDEIICFSRSSKLLEAFETRPADVVFLDIEMPGMTGLELAKALTEKKEELNIVFVTGYGEYAAEAFDLFASGYILKPCDEKSLQKVLSKLRYPVEKPKDVFIKTFGNFDVFYRGEPVKFRTPQSKELLAYLVDRLGALVSRQEVAATLFEDDFSRNAQARLSQIASRLAEDLNSAGVLNLFCHERGYRVDLSDVDCDLNAFVNGSSKFPFLGEYMEQYSWAEYRKGDFMRG